MKRNHLIILGVLLGVLVPLLCFAIYVNQGNAVNGIGDLIFGFISFIIEGFTGILFALLDFFAKLVFGVLTLWN